jgi:hypothetical protein
MDEPKPRDWRSNPRKTDAQRFSFVATLRLPGRTKETLRQLASKSDSTEAEAMRCLIDSLGKAVLESQTDVILLPKRRQSERVRSGMALMRELMRQYRRRR